MTLYVREWVAALVITSIDASDGEVLKVSGTTWIRKPRKP